MLEKSFLLLKMIKILLMLPTQLNQENSLALMTMLKSLTQLIDIAIR